LRGPGGEALSDEQPPLRLREPFVPVFCDQHRLAEAHAQPRDVHVEDHARIEHSLGGRQEDPGKGGSARTGQCVAGDVLVAVPEPGLEHLLAAGAVDVLRDGAGLHPRELLVLDLDQASRGPDLRGGWLPDHDRPHYPCAVALYLRHDLHVDDVAAYQPTIVEATVEERRAASRDGQRDATAIAASAILAAYRRYVISDSGLRRRSSQMILEKSTKVALGSAVLIASNRRTGR
jgi:hypothetical protein